MITLDQLISIQNAMGIACVVSVFPGTNPNEIWIKIEAPNPDKTFYRIERMFSMRNIFYSDLERELDRFKHEAKTLLDVHFAKYKV